MKTILNYQPLKLQGTKGFLNVETKEDVKIWKRKLEQSHYLHKLGVKLSKANRSYVFAILTKLQDAEDGLIKLIQDGGTTEQKEDLKEVIAEHKALLIELSEIQDEIPTQELPAPRPNLITMIVFEKIVSRETLPTQYITKRNRKFIVQNPTMEIKHMNLVNSCFDLIATRKKAEIKATKAEQKAKEKSDSFVEKVHEKKNLNK